MSKERVDSRPLDESPLSLCTPIAHRTGCIAHVDGSRTGGPIHKECAKSRDTPNSETSDEDGCRKKRISLGPNMILRFNYTCFYTHIYFPSTGRVTSDTEGRVLTEYITGGSYIIVSRCSLVCTSYRNSGMVACYSQGRVLLSAHALSIMRSLSPVRFIISTPVVLAQPTRRHSRQTRTRPTHT